MIYQSIIQILKENKFLWLMKLQDIDSMLASLESITLKFDNCGF